MSDLDTLPVAVIGAGPVGLAAAAHLVRRGLTPAIFERGPAIGAAMREWGHVRVFSPWRYNVDSAARALLVEAGWDEPDEADLPTGGEIVTRYLAPLAALPAIAPHLRLGASVTSVVRENLDKMSSANRDNTPFLVRWTDASGDEHSLRVRAVIDASGTWTRPNPLGVDGLSVPGERRHAGRIAYGIPDVLADARATYTGRRVLVVGSGHSAMQNVLALLDLQRDAPGTSIVWGMRRARLDALPGGGVNDQLPARGALGLAAKRAIDAGLLTVRAPFAVQRIEADGDALRVTATAAADATTLTVDRIVVATGFRPELDLLRELRIALDPAVEAPPALAPLIDPNLHSCGTVPPHGVAELAHPEGNVFIVGAKSYGRAPTFLMATGYEQVRSVVAELAGDPVAARQVQLVLPETGVCSVAPLAGEADAGCCGGPASTTDSCCAADEVAKTEGAAGCGCGTAAQPAITGKVREPA